MKTHYYGESGRTVYDGGQNHWRDLENKCEENPMVIHWMEHHQEVTEWKEIFKMRVLKTFPSALRRHSFEGFKIGNYKGDIPLNRKGEWGNNVPPQVDSGG